MSQKQALAARTAWEGRREKEAVREAARALRSSDRLPEMIRLVEWRLKRFRSHAEWDDIRQEGLVAAWQAWQRYPQVTFSRVVCCAAYWGALDYLRSTACRQPLRRKEVTAAPQFLELDEAAASHGREAPDPQAVALARLECRQLIGLLRPREWQVIRLLFWEEWSKEDVARALSLHRSSVHDALQRGLNRYRRELGLPEKQVNRNSYQRRRDREREAAHGGF